MKKRIKGIIPAVVLSMVPVTCVFAASGFAADTETAYHGTLTATADKTEANAGDEVSVTVELTENTGFITFLASLDYDPDVLTLTDFSYGDTFSGWVAPVSSILTGSKMYWHIAYGDDTSTGLLVTMTFTVNDGVNYTVTEVGLDVESCYDTDFNELEIGQTKAEITIPCSHVWDEGVVTTEPTATQEGVKTYTCTICGETTTEAVGAIATIGDTIVLRSGNTFSFRYTLESEEPDLVITYGRVGDDVLIGDWDGDGIDTVCVRRGNTFYFKNDFTSGDADIVLSYGRAGDEVLAGDWNADGKDTLAVRRDGNVCYFKYSITGGVADEVIAYGRSADVMLVGDWDGDGKDTLCARRGNVYYFKNAIESGNADEVFTYGSAADDSYAGRWR